MIRAIVPLAIILAATAAVASEDADLREFCANIADPARERRYALKQAELEDLRAGIEKRMEALEAKRADYEDWSRRRAEFAEQAKGQLVAIFAKMRPDAAAARLELIDPSLAAAIVMRLKPGRAGVILNEMDETRAAGISSIIAASAVTEKPAS